MKKNFFAGLMVGIMIAGMANTVGATLISMDWKTTGDGLLTLDTETGYKWLDVTFTVGMTANEVISKMSKGGIFKGFRYATSSDINTMWLNLGWSGLNTSERTLQDGAMALSAFNLFGYMYPSPDVIDTTTELNGIYFEENGRADLIGMAYILYDTKDNGKGYAFYRDDQISLNNASDYRWGSYLITTTKPHPIHPPHPIHSAVLLTSAAPIPSAILLLGSGLGCLVLCRRRKLTGKN